MTEQLPSQNPSESEKPLEQKMAEFRAEAQALREKALIEPGSYDLVEGEFKPEELTEEDMLIYEKFKSETLTLEELENWKMNAVGTKNLNLSLESGGKSGSQRNTRNMWTSHISNKMASREAVKELEKRKKEKGL